MNGRLNKPDCVSAPLFDRAGILQTKHHLDLIVMRQKKSSKLYDVKRFVQPAPMYRMARNTPRHYGLGQTSFAPYFGRRYEP